MTPPRFRLSRIQGARFGAGLVFLFALLVFGRTLAPSITWRNAGADSGDLVTAAWVGGVPHPPGYPLYTLLAQGMTLLPWGEVAFRVNGLSALAAALAVLLVFFVSHFLQAQPGFTRNSLFAGVGALLLAFSPLYWSQATIAEVYALHALLFVLALGSLLVWSLAQDHAESVAPTMTAWAPIVGGVTLGLGLAHHLTILLLLPSGFILLWQKVPLRRLGLVLGLAVLVAGLFYLTLPLRAAANPPINWGNPRSLANLAWLISGEAYRGYLWGIALVEYPARLGDTTRMLVSQFGWLGVALGVAGAMGLFQRAKRAGSALLVTFLLYLLFAVGYASQDAFVYLLPAWIVFALWIAEGLGIFVQLLGERLGVDHRSQQKWIWGVGVAAMLLPLSSLWANGSAMDLSQDTTARDYGRAVLASVPAGAIVIADKEDHLFALWYAHYVQAPAQPVTLVSKGLLVYPWYRENLRREHPELVWPSAIGLEWSEYLRRFAQANFEAQPVFWTSSDSYFTHFFQFEPAGLLYRVSTRASLAP